MFTCKFTESREYLNKYDDLVKESYMQAFDVDLSKMPFPQNHCICENLLAITKQKEVIGGVKLYISCTNQILPMEQTFDVILSDEIKGIKFDGESYCELSRLVVAPNMRKNPKILETMGEQIVYKAKEVYQCNNMFAASLYSHIRVYKRIAKLFNLEINYEKKTYIPSEKYRYKGNFYLIKLKLR